MLGCCKILLWLKFKWIATWAVKQSDKKVNKAQGKLQSNEVTPQSHTQMGVTAGHIGSCLILPKLYLATIKLVAWELVPYKLAGDKNASGTLGKYPWQPCNQEPLKVVTNQGAWREEGPTDRVTQNN